jgi:hypothetical protein
LVIGDIATIIIIIGKEHILLIIKVINLYIGLLGRKPRGLNIVNAIAMINPKKMESIITQLSKLSVTPILGKIILTKYFFHTIQNSLLNMLRPLLSI